MAKNCARIAFDGNAAIDAKFSQGVLYYPINKHYLTSYKKCKWLINIFREIIMPKNHWFSEHIIEIMKTGQNTSSSPFTNALWHTGLTRE
jgi:hypothetical protein